MILISYDLSHEISLYFSIPTLIGYLILLLWLTFNLAGQSYYISIPLLEFMMYNILFEILFIFLNFNYHFSKWHSMAILWILLFISCFCLEFI